MSKELVFIKENKAVTDSLTVAEMFGKRHDAVLRDIRTQMEYSGHDFSLHNFVETQYQNEQNKQFYPKFDITEDAFMLVCMSYNTKEAVQMKIKFIQEFKRMREILSKPPQTQLEILQASINQLVQQEQRILAIENRTNVIEQKQNNITEILSLNPTEWRKKSTNLLNQIAKQRGGFDAYKDVRAEAYQLLEERAKCRLSIRLTNKKSEMALNGASKSKIDKVNKIDVIADDARLTEIFLAIIKEMAIASGVDMGV